MSSFGKLSQLSRFINFAACGSLLAVTAVDTTRFSAVAQERDLTVTPLVVSQIQVDTREDNYRRDDDYTRTLRAESGPDDRGRWRFYKPQDVSRDAMQAQGCTDVGAGEANWRCPRRTIRVEVNNERPDDERSTQRLRAESGPDDRGRWRFYKPQDVSRDEMQAQGCVDVGAGGANWRCPRRTIRVQVDNERPDYGRSNRRLRAESGPDDKGRWRFYKPQDVSRDEMQSQGCTDVGTGGANWRCPRPTIRVQVDNRGR